MKNVEKCFYSSSYPVLHELFERGILQFYLTDLLFYLTAKPEVMKTLLLACVFCFFFHQN